MVSYESFEPILRVLPEVPRPLGRLPFRTRLLWTGIVLVIYLVMSQIPLYGIPWRAEYYQRLFFLQIVLASRRGTLMELGIGPIVTSGLIWQILVGSRVIKIDLTSPRGRSLFTGLQKLFAIIFTFVEALAYILGGMYGALSTPTAIIVFAQLVSATLLLMLMDEMLQKGWGIGSGISLFIAAGVAQQIFWQLFSPLGPLMDGFYVGVIPSFVYAIVNATNTGNWDVLNKIVLRPYGLPDITGLIATILLFAFLLYLENMRIEVPVAASRYGGIRTKIPFKFLYVSNVPVILVSALFADIHIFSRLAWSRLNPNNQNQWFNFIAKYNITRGRELEPLPGCLVYYLSPPSGLLTVMEDPLRFIIYAALFVLLSVLFSIAWVETSGMDPRSQAQQLVEAQLLIPGFRRSTRVIASLLERYIPILTIISGLVVGLIAVLSNLFGVLGTGIGLLLMIDIVLQYQGLIMQERILEMYPMLRRIVGK